MPCTLLFLFALTLCNIILKLSPFCLARSRTYVFYLFACMCECVCVYYLLLTGCRALFTFNQYFVTFGSGHLRKKRGNDNRQQTVSNSLFCVYVYAKYNQTTDRARGTVLPPFPLLTILPTVLANERHREGERERVKEVRQRCSGCGSRSKSSENYLQSICTHTHTHTLHIYEECIRVCVYANSWKLRRSWRWEREKKEDRQLAGLTW